MHDFEETVFIQKINSIFSLNIRFFTKKNLEYLKYSLPEWAFSWSDPCMAIR